MASPRPQLSEDTAGCSEGCVAWVNALVGRIFWDFLRERYWAEQVSSKIQKKLSKIKVRSRNGHRRLQYPWEPCPISSVSARLW